VVKFSFGTQSVEPATDGLRFVGVRAIAAGCESRPVDRFQRGMMQQAEDLFNHLTSVSYL
jgi:hypothetical protein